ncbi:MAG: MBL fold metallo-hydrolase RNA specificity domain-containing protein, partial [Bacillota bacterium]
LIPKLCAQGFKGPIYCTFATADLASILLPDSAHIQETEVERKNRKLTRAGKPLLSPIYTIEDAYRCMNQFRPYSYDEMFKPANDVEIRLRDAGHILGSAIVEIWVTESGKTTKLVFSGDLGNSRQRIIKDPTYIENADYVILESTYGDRLHQANTTRIDRLLEAIEFTRRKGGNLIIPAFAVERTQDLIYDLNLLYKQGKLPREQKIYIDSPLAIAATEIFKRSAEFYDNETRQLLMEGNDPFMLPNLKYSRTREDSVGLNESAGGSIIISASGMCDAGRIKHHLKHNLWRPDSTILFVGYQAEGTLGRCLLDGEKLVRIHGEQVAVKADIVQIDSYSAHADQAGIISWLKHFVTPPQQIILVHGEEQSQATLAQLITNELGIPVCIPDWLDEIDLAGAPQECPVGKPLEAQPAVLAGSRALEAEEAYLQFRLELNRHFQSNWEAGQYERLIKNLNEARKALVNE